MTNLDERYYSILPEVDEALRLRKPIVALESTVITHGLPFPENIRLAQDVEEEIRKLNCIPATIAILDGKICIGIGPSQLEELVKREDAIKISVRNISSAVAGGKWGGTTVAGTLAIAQDVGIKVFATGGIGGVHRDSTFDVSTDLIQLSRSRLIVVCAGAKAILDIPATLEVLETYGVPVIGYQTDVFPAFYSISSGMPVSVQVDSAEEVINIAKVHWNLGMQSALLVVVPPPKEVAIPRENVEEAIEVALKEAGEKLIRGQNVTPYLLGRVSELTGGMSLQANLGLLRNNARIAAEIARSIAINNFEN